jgi:hypothetical protein
VTLTFSLPHKQKSQQIRVKQNCQYCKGAFSKKILQGIKQNTAIFQGSKNSFTLLNKFKGKISV